MKVFYRPEQVAPEQASSPSAHKPKLVVHDWASRSRFNLEVCSFEPVTERQLARAHDPTFVLKVLGCQTPNGFGNCCAGVAASLVYTSGSLLSAAEHALLHREVVCSPTSGFHHARYGRASGYCTFNGLMVTALAIKESGLANRVAILDCDAHYGDGTDDIIRRLGIDWIEHHTQGLRFQSARDARGGQYERWLEQAIRDCLDCDLVLYQAGADPHVDDPLGGILTTEQMSGRDRMVFERLGHLPMVWNLAGGYQLVPGKTGAEQIEPVLALHRETARLHCELFG